MKKNNYKYLRLFKTSFLLFIIYSCLFSKTEHNTIEVNRLTRDYYIYTPDTININTALILILHGYSGSALGIMNYSGFNKLVNDHNFIACYPQGTKDDKGYAFWNVGYAFHPGQTVDDVQFIVKLVSRLKNNYNISERNIFVTGMSNGGEMSYMLGCHTKGVFKAIASITGVMFNSFLNNCNPNPINVFEVHGTKDKTNWWQGDADNKGGWGTYIGVEEGINYWVDVNNCQSFSSDTLFDSDESDGSYIISDLHTNGINSTQVLLYKVINGGHDWPGSSGNMDINASEEVLKFFHQFRLNIK